MQFAAEIIERPINVGRGVGDLSCAWPGRGLRLRSALSICLASRFPKTIVFPDYTTDELVTIFQQSAARAGYTLGEATATAVHAWLDALPRGKGFGNGREARNLFEASIARHAARVVAIEKPTDEDLTVLVPADVAGVETGSDWRNDR